jgi:cytochrome b subunit of formate dehydrogenase
MADRIIDTRGLVTRHTVIELTEHWLLAISGIVLIMTGLFQMPLPRRYYITDIPGMAWSGDFMITLNIHYIASIIFTAVALFHVVYHGMLRQTSLLPKKGDIRESIAVIKTFFGKGEEPPFHKYLPEQRIAYAGMAAIIAVLILSGIVKTYKNVYDPQMSVVIVSWATWLHNIGAVLFILAFAAHVAAVLLKPNFPMLRGIVLGSIRLEYAKRRHPLWIADIQRVPAFPEAPQEKTDTVAEAADVPTVGDQTDSSANETEQEP